MYFKSEVTIRRKVVELTAVETVKPSRATSDAIFDRLSLESGIILEHLTISNVCTCENSDELFSHRATGGKRGNQGAFLMLT